MPDNVGLNTEGPARRVRCETRLQHILILANVSDHFRTADPPSQAQFVFLQKYISSRSFPSA